MQYFRNYELANMYNVSQAAVGKWILSAKSKKLDLTLIEDEGKSYIANTTKNLATIEEMVKERKKYFNTRSLKMVTPKPEFYELYTREQTLDMVSNLDIHREIPIQYSYFDGGADYWDVYTKRLADEDTPNLLTSTLDLLQLNQPYIDSLTKGYKRVNVIDIGVGNGYPIKTLLADLLQKGVLGRYIALDISQDMLDIAERNIRGWFGDAVKFEGFVRDINYDRFFDLLAMDSFTEDRSECINMVAFLGGTLSNFRSPRDVIKVINSSMGSDDILLYAAVLDSPSTRLYFDFNAQDSAPLSPKGRLLLDLLGIDETLYDVEKFFDEKLRARFIRIKMKVAISMKFCVGDSEKQVNLHKGESVLIWRHWHSDAIGILKTLEDSGFNTLQASESTDRSFMLTLSQIKTDHAA